ncbi:MAG: hypothetical protein K9I94_01880 [Bacteroidales bacterium]|nr:hypothetical protein [Bacteroidales bacterium]
MKKFTKSTVFLVLLFISNFLIAQTVPNLIDYQGKLSDSDGNPLDEQVSITFSIYPVSSGGSALWSETQEQVYVSEGVFHVLLGSQNPFPADLFDQSSLWLGINVNNDGEMTPRSRIASVPFAMKSASSVPDEDWSIEGDYMYSADKLVGIGTSSPATKLEVSKSGENFMRITSTSNERAGLELIRPGAANYRDWRIFNDGGNLYFNVDNDEFIEDDGTNLLYMDYLSHQIGVGTQDPTAKFEVDGGIKATSFTGDASGLTNLPWQLNGDNVYREEGFVGIGTNDPDTHLDIISSNSSTWIKLDAANDAGSGIVFAQAGLQWWKLKNYTVGQANRMQFEIAGMPVVDIGIIESVGMNLYKLDGAKTISLQTTENNQDGSSIKLYKSNGDLSLELDAEYGGVGGDSRIITDVLKITGGSDLAEPFNTKDENIEKGMVLSIDPESPGQLMLSDKSYDKCVAGIASGAGGINAGMIMGQKESIANGDVPVALTGRVYCWVDATENPVNPGDLLTTSDTPGHAMKVNDHTKAHGAIIGKAMTSLDKGTGLVLVLVALQ